MNIKTISTKLPVKKAKEKRLPMIKWQKANVAVLYALIPVVITSVYFFGLRSLLLLCTVTAAGFLTEYIFLRAYYKEPVTSAVFVSSLLFTMTLPPTLPLWMAVVGIIFGIAFGKMVFGGFGRNVFNPALTGRIFIYISFGVPMTSVWVVNFERFPGGFISFSSDAVTKATPMAKIASGTNVPWLSMLLGNTPGCIGETSALLIIIGGIYLIIKKYANYRIVISGFIGMLVLQTLLWLSGIKGAIDPLRAVLGGGFMLGMMFMATDPVSASQTNAGRWIYGGIVGVLTSLIRVFSIWKEGVMFAILLGNMFVPIIDYYIKRSTRKE
ncbi:MAG: RnfABCDGE type electron transport complex subunit D [Spirochaetota bacterium]